MSTEDLIEIDRAGRRCAVCRSGRRRGRFIVVRSEGREPVVMCEACRARHAHIPPPRATVEAATGTTAPPVATSHGHRPKPSEDRLKRVLRELPRGEHSTGRIAKAAGLNQRKALGRLRQLEASGEVRQVGKRWSTEPAPTDVESAFDRLQARTSNIRIVRESRSRASG